MSRLVGEISPINQNSEDIVSCNQCRSTDLMFDTEKGERVCQSCGVVLAEKLESSEIETNPNFGLSKAEYIGMPSSLAQADKGLSTVIPYSRTDGNGSVLSSEQRGNMQRMIRWNKISTTNRSYHRNLKSAFSLLLRVKDKLSLSESVTEKAAYYYRKIVDLNMIKGRSIKGFVVGCTYIACRESGVLRSIDEISNAIDTDRVFAGKCYRLLMRRLKIKLPQVDTRPYLTRIANNAGVSEKTMRKAAEMLSTIKDNPITYGKAPNALAVAVLYGACLIQGEKISQGSITEAANISIVSLRKRLLDIRKVFPEVPASLKI